jgi:hypothetical protein
MKVAFLTPYYPPELGAPQGRLSGLADAFLQAGHTVSVLTAMPNYPSGRIHAGYGGLVAGTCFAESGNDVVCVDNVAEKIESLRQGKVPIYEPGLEELIRRNVTEGRLTFTTELAEPVRKSVVCFVAVGKPEKPDG